MFDVHFFSKPYSTIATFHVADLENDRIKHFDSNKLKRLRYITLKLVLLGKNGFSASDIHGLGHAQNSGSVILQLSQNFILLQGTVLLVELDD